MNGWHMVATVVAVMGVVFLWLGRNSRTREPMYWDDGSVVLPSDIHRAAYVCGVWSSFTAGFALLLGNQVDVSRIDWLMFVLCCHLLMAGLLGLFAASRISASFTPSGIEVNHPLQSVRIPWSSFQRLEPGPYSTARLVATPSPGVTVRAPRLLQARAARDRTSGVFSVSLEALVGGYAMFEVELAQARARLAGSGPCES